MSDRHPNVDGLNSGPPAIYGSCVDDDFLARALELAMQARERGDHPFGALLAVDGDIVAEARNRVVSDQDITAHAELMLVRQLEDGDRLELLRQGTVFASCEPCPMCVGAMFWAGVRRVVFALSHSRLNELVRPPAGESVGFHVSASEIGCAAVPPMSFDGPHRQDEAANAHVGFWH
ncbi:MAG: nucleoside deaminase [Ilumatobacter sp.]